MADIAVNHVRIPHRDHVGLITCDAKDLDTKFDPIEGPAHPRMRRTSWS